MHVNNVLLKVHRNYTVTDRQGKTICFINIHIASRPSYFKFVVYPVHCTMLTAYVCPRMSLKRIFSEADTFEL